MFIRNPFAWLPVLILFTKLNIISSRWPVWNVSTKSFNAAVIFNWLMHKWEKKKYSIYVICKSCNLESHKTSYDTASFCILFIVSKTHKKPSWYYQEQGMELFIYWKQFAFPTMFAVLLSIQFITGTLFILKLPSKTFSYHHIVICTQSLQFYYSLQYFYPRVYWSIFRPPATYFKQCSVIKASRLKRAKVHTLCR